MIENVVDIDYRELFQLASDALFYLDEKMTILDVNEIACERLGYTREELIGKSLKEIDSPVSASRINERIRQILETGFSTFESTHRTKDGREIPVEVSARTVPRKDRVYFFSIVRDITRRKDQERILAEREAKYRAAIETSSDGFWVVDLKGNFLEVNDKYVQMSGYTREELLNMKVPDVEALEQPEETKEHIEKILMTGSDRFETWHRKKNGERWPVEIVTTYWPIGDGQLMVYVVDITDRKNYEQKILDLSRLPQQNPNPVFRVDVNGNILFANNATKVLLDIWRESCGLPDELKKSIIHAFLNEEQSTVEISVQDSFYLFCIAPVLDGGYLNIYGMNITNQIRTQEQVKVLSRAVNQSPISVMITDLHGKITYVNPSFTQITGYSREEAIGKNPRFLKSGRQAREFYRNMWDKIRSGEEWKGEFSNRKKDGTEFWESATISAVLDSSGSPISYIAVKEDITEKKKKEERILFLAMHDPLTGLYNRASFMDHLGRILHMADRNKSSTALLFMDLNGFKEVNDQYGHQAGDQLLIKVADDLRQSVRQMDIVARMGGDEFAIILPEVSGREQIEAIVKRILNSIQRPLQIGSTFCQAGISIGISTYPGDRLPLEEFLQCADRAMYEAKRSGNNRFVYCEELTFPIRK